MNEKLKEVNTSITGKVKISDENMTSFKTDFTSKMVVIKKL